MSLRFIPLRRCQLFRPTPSSCPIVRSFTTLPARRNKHSGSPGENGPHAGINSRTDNEVVIEHPNEHALPSSTPYSGRGAEHTQPTLPTFSLSGRTIVVTGGARGLGLVMAQAAVISGADVALVDLNKEEGTKQAAAILDTWKSTHPSSSGSREPKITAHYADVSSPDSVSSCLEEIFSSHSQKIDGLVTSAGFTENFPAEEFPPDRMRKLWGVNVDGTYLFATGIARHLMQRKTKGSMVFVGSMSGAIVNVPQPQAPYNASKAAVRQLAASLAVEWAHAGIRVNCISPGYMMTALTRKILDENPELEKKWVGLIPVGKMGSPQDLMGAVVYLLSDAAAYTTGADLRIDGGYTVT